MSDNDRGATRRRQDAVLGDAGDRWNPLDAAVRALGWDDPTYTAGDRRAAARLRVTPAAVRKWRTRRSYPTGLRLRRVERFLESAATDLRRAGKIRAGLADLASAPAEARP